VAIYHFQAKIISRGQGRGIVAAAAYRSAECLFDDELGRSQNFEAKVGVIHKQIILPAGAPNRWLDRATLWNEVAAADPVRAERPGDVLAVADGDWRKRPRYRQLAREIEIALPRELSQAEAIRLAHDFVCEQFVARGMVADLAVHWGTAAHVLLTLRRVDPAGRRRLEKARDRHAVTSEQAGFGPKERGWNDRALVALWRERWAEMANARLAELGHDVRIDHRANAAQGLGLEPQNKIGPAAARRARHGEEGERTAEHRAITRHNGARLLVEPELALNALTQQQSTFTRADLARLVHRQSDGAAQFAAIMARVEASPALVRVGEDGRGQVRFSTAEMVEVERRMEAAAVALDRQARHAVPLARRQAPPSSESGLRLDTEQLLAFQHVTRARDLAVVAGVAGSGKSTMLGVARQVWEKAGYRVRGAALSGIAAEGLAAGSGIESRTVASLEHAWRQGRELLEARDVLVVDEAGMVGSRQMGRVLDAAVAAGAKVVLVGDAEQLQAIEAGAAFRAVAERVGVASIGEVRRQRAPWQREATRELASGRSAAALGRYQGAGAIHGHATLDAAKDQLAALAEADAAARPGVTQILLAHRRMDVADLNARIRARRREAMMLGPERLLPLAVGERALAEGDRVYFLRNDRGLGVKNGTLGTVRRITGTDEAVRLQVQLDAPEGIGRGRIVGFSLADYADLDHGYAATVHKAQSVTVDRAYVLATEGMDRHLAYVALSRHRDAVSLHWSTDSFADGAALVRQLGRERAKDTTLDYAEGDPAGAQAYAERRGITPLWPDSAIVMPPGTAMVPEQQADPGPARPEPHGQDVRPGDAPKIAAILPVVEELHGQPKPMLQAEHLPPATEVDVTALAAAKLAAVDRLPKLLGTAYRDPGTAQVRLDALLQAHRDEAAVAALLREQGPQLLGKLRGAKGLFASVDAVVEREIAEAAATAIPDQVARQPEFRAIFEAAARADLDQARQLATVEVPGLSAEAAGVLQALQRTGAGWTLPTETTVGAMTKADQHRVAVVAQVWGRVLAKPELGAEFARFEAAVDRRLLPDQQRALVLEWEARQDLQVQAATLSLPGEGVAAASRPSGPGLPPLPPQVLASVFARVIGHARTLAPLHEAHAARVAQDADLPMRAIRERLTRERMAPWWAAENRRWDEWELQEVRSAPKDRVPPAQVRAWRNQRIEAEQARVDAEVRALPVSELLRIKAGCDEQERQAEAAARVRPAARPWPSPSPF